MSKKHPLFDIVQQQKSRNPVGIYSVCSASDLVITAAMERAMIDNEYVLIEATANQVNQYGGYTGMVPKEFKEFVFALARKVSFPCEKIILGGDHLGPLTWKDEPSDSALEKAKELIEQYVLAGFSKIHIDTSMHLGDDDHTRPLPNEIIAERGAVLAETSEKAFADFLKDNADSWQPVYVIGSEVPIPGGVQGKDETLHITSVNDLHDTLSLFKKSFLKHRLTTAWNHVIAVVVQPGVEFGNETIHEYDRHAAKELCASLQNYKFLVFEGHSTDFQPVRALKSMVEDGVAILKVGPALTFAMREGLFALAAIEEELFQYKEDIQLSKFKTVLEDEMLNNPSNWKQHYHGDNSQVALSRKYSFSDRCRYYIPAERVQKSIARLFNNLNQVEIPLSLISQYMPIQYLNVINKKLKKNPEALVKDRIMNCINDYISATTGNSKDNQ